MTDSPWLGDTCSLVEAFRSGERHPVEEMTATLAAIEASTLNAFTHLEPEQALEAASHADVSQPFGGVPIGIKALTPVQGWPHDECSAALVGEVADHTSLHVERLQEAGAIGVGQTNASEFGGLNVSINRVYGITHNPWQNGLTAGGSSGGSASAVAGGLVTIATAGDGGGSIRIPGAFNGLVGMKGTAGRIPRGPKTEIFPMTVVTGPMARSVRDVCRWYDVAAGYDSRDPYSLPKIEGWERDLGSFDLRGKRAVIAPNLGIAVLRPEVETRVREAAELLARDAGLELVEVPVNLPGLGYEWALTNLCQLKRALGDRWPDCRDDLTTEIAFGLTLAEQHFDLDMMARCEIARTEANERMAEVFDSVDFIFAATNPDVAFGAEVYLNQLVGGRAVGPENNGALTIPANIVGNPAISVPIEALDGLPVGLQIIGRHHEDQLLFDLAAIVERERPWPLVAPSAPV
ncbi:MAG TPA: amidase [Acidimicrobiaceae bacterium]|jgi:Asp-tRNA(Asn)/Glu-tRNA(Gln) amidotransferase A subunit family amidase|nr:amidase [Acidimicrobiaceae bacterium]